MATEIKMPQLSDTMDRGKILSWSKKVGDKISRGDILAEVETEKANLEIESFSEGELLAILVPAQTAAKVGEVIAVIGKPGESYSGAPAPAASAAPSPAPAAPAPVATAPAPQPHAAPSFSAPPPPPSPAPARQLHAVGNGNGASDRIKASPLARRMAEERNIDLSVVRGTGPEGRIVKRDIEAVGSAPAPVSATGNVARAPQSSSEPAPHPTTTSGGQLVPFTKMREVIARRMQESVTQSPHFQVSASINMGEAKRLYTTLKERPEFKGISLNHLVIKAAAYGLAHEPRVNRAVRDNMIFEPNAINIGIITALEDGLLIPVVKEADTLALKDLVFEARAAVERARAGRPSSSDLTGGTFSISNMGMYDVETFTAIINPGQGAVLAVSTAKETPVVQNGVVTVGLVMQVTISVDHRIIDGAMAANFLNHFKAALETPALLLL